MVALAESVAMPLLSRQNLRCRKEDRLRNSRSHTGETPKPADFFPLASHLQGEGSHPFPHSCPISDVRTEPSTWSALFFHLGSWSRNQITEPCSYEQIPAIYSVFRLESHLLPVWVSKVLSPRHEWVLDFLSQTTSNLSVRLALIAGWLYSSYCFQMTPGEGVSNEQRTSLRSSGVFQVQVHQWNRCLSKAFVPSCNVILSDSIRCKVRSPVCKKLMF